MSGNCKPEGRSMDPLNDACRCCLSSGYYMKDIFNDYLWLGKREIYSEMLSETFDIMVRMSSDSDISIKICEVCIGRLRDATEFRKQVEEAQAMFKQLSEPNTYRISSRKSTKARKRNTLNLSATLKSLEKSNVSVKVIKSKRKRISKKSSEDTTNEDGGYSKKFKVMDNTFSDRQNARILVKHTTAYPFRLPSTAIVCAYCGHSYERASQFRAHMQANHRVFKISSAFSRLGGMYLKVDCTDLTCRKCSLPLQNLYEAADHLSNEHELTQLNLQAEMGLMPFTFKEDKKFNCAICQKTLPGMIELSRHTGTHFEKYPCETCGKCYVTMASLRAHVTFSHGSGGKIPCRKCKELFPNNEEKNQHVMDTKACWPYTCWKCNEKFRSYRTKKRHMEEQHGVKIPHTCTECGLEFSTAQKRNRHFTLTHAIAPYICSDCGSKFVGRAEFESHKLVHTKEMSFKCMVCTKAFARPKTLKQHMWIHMEEKRFECKPCNKKFNAKVCWKMHMKGYHSEFDEEILDTKKS